MSNISANTEEEQLLFRGSRISTWKIWIIDHKKLIIGVTCVLLWLAIVTVFATVVVVLIERKSDVTPTTPTPAIPTMSTVHTSTSTTTTIRTTTPKTATPSTTPKTTNSTTIDGPLHDDVMGTFHPSAVKPLPTNVTNFPPVNLLIDMGMRPNFSEIPCIQNYPSTFKYQVTVLDFHTFYGEDQSRRVDAKVSAARVANEELFNFHYPTPMPFPAKIPCNGTLS